MAHNFILALGGVDAFVVERLSSFGEVVVVNPTDPTGISGYLPNTIAIMARASSVVDSPVIAAAPRLKVIARSGVGVENIDLAAATARGIPVVITPGAGTNAVAEGALAMMLYLVKRLGSLTDLVREGRWEQRESTPVGDLDGATLGIVGYGRIGRRLGDLARAFGMRVLVHDPLLPDISIELLTLVAESDVVSLHAPLTPDTRGMVDARLLAKFRPGAMLVNCARGGLLDVDAVYDALEQGKLGGVGLDVFDVEPPLPHPLFGRPDVVLSPHVLGLSMRARRLTFEAMAEGVEAVLSGRQAPAVANPAVYQARVMQ